MFTKVFTRAPKYKQHRFPLNNEWVKNVECPYNGILFGSLWNSNSDTCYSVVKPWKH